MSNWFQLEHLGSISLRGKGAQAFAQSQFTSDVVSGAEDWFKTTAWCDSRGRAISVMLAKAREGAVDLVLPRDQVEPVLARLSLFAIGHEVEIAPRPGVAGTFEGRSAAGALAHDPGRALSTESAEQAPADAATLYNWQLADLCTGFPWLGPRTAARHLPQFLGLESFDGISYDKGCYPGQEIIARLHYLGRIKYQLRGVTFAGSSRIPPAAPLNDGEGGRIGEVLYGMTVESGFAALAVLDSGLEPGSAVRAEADGEHPCGEVTDLQALC